MNFDSQRNFRTRRANDEFLRRMHGGEIAGAERRERTVPVFAGTEISAKNDRPLPRCDGTYPDGGNPENGNVPSFPSLAMVYSPVQEWKEVLTPEEGLRSGSIFRQLLKPLENAGAGGGRK